MGIQMSRKELTKTFMMISNKKKMLLQDIHGLYKNISALKRLTFVLLCPYMHGSKHIQIIYYVTENG